MYQDGSVQFTLFLPIAKVKKTQRFKIDRGHLVMPGHMLSLEILNKMFSSYSSDNAFA